MNPVDVASLVWLCAAPVVGGVAFEVLKRGGNEEPFFAIPVAFLWPLVLVAAALLGAGWCASWLGRGPYLLVARIAERRDRLRLHDGGLPVARINKELP